ncbi:hypothetical protein LXL04_031749 [Taraxacum kok-saghyz]
MTSHLDRWEKDPFFHAAEEVQESADRMESTYRTLIHASKEPSVWNSEALRRDLQTALGTTKWQVKSKIANLNSFPYPYLIINPLLEINFIELLQLEEFERAVLASYNKTSTDNTKDRHRDFINAIESQISRVETSWNDSFSKGKPPRPWVKLNEGERKELALFLAGSGTTGGGEEQSAKTRRKQKAAAREKKFSGHRRAASASADIGSWKITIDDDVGKDQKTPRKIPSFSGLLNKLEYSASRLKWPKNGYRKLKQESDGGSLETRSLIEGHEISEHCDDHYYDRWLHQWCGAFQRLSQRFQYYILYSCRTQTIFWILVLICLLAMFVLDSF